MSTFDDPFDADRELNRAGCVCGQHRSVAEHQHAKLAMRCEPVESEEKRYEGVVASTAGERNAAGLTLRDVKELSAPGAPLKDQLFIAAPDIDTWSSGPADAKVPNGDCRCYPALYAPLLTLSTTVW